MEALYKSTGLGNLCKTLEKILEKVMCFLKESLGKFLKYFRRISEADRVS